MRARVDGRIHSHQPAGRSVPGRQQMRDELWRSPPPSNFVARLLIRRVIILMNLGYPRIYPQT